MLKCYIIESNNDDVIHLISLINQSNSLIFSGKNDNLGEGLLNLKNSPTIDVLFLNIEMTIGLKGINVIQLVPEGTSVVLMASNKNHAYKAFENGALDFLLKPYNHERFKRCIFKLNRIPRQKSFNEKGMLRLNLKSKILQIPLDEILLIESFDHNLSICCLSDKYNIYMSIGEMDNCLPILGFCRIHRCYIINLAKIRTVEGNHVILLTGVKLPVGDSYKNAFLKKFSIG